MVRNNVEGRRLLESLRLPLGSTDWPELKENQVRTKRKQEVSEVKTLNGIEKSSASCRDDVFRKSCPKTTEYQIKQSKCKYDHHMKFIYSLIFH